MKIIVGGNHKLVKLAFFRSIEKGEVSYFDNTVANNNSLRVKIQRRLYGIAKKLRIISQRRYEDFQRYDNARELFDFDSISKKEAVVFILCEMNVLFSDIETLKCLKHRFPKSRLVGCFLNRIGAVNSNNQMRQKTVLENKKVYDLLLACSGRDAKEYGMDFLDFFPYDGICLEKDEKYVSDILWLGTDKGRKNDLEIIANKLLSIGLTVKFILVDIYNEYPEQEGQITITHKYLDYYEYLKYVFNTKCLLDIDVFEYYTLRFKEAIAYKKLYLTNNPMVLQLEQGRYSNKNQIKYFSSIEDLDMISFDYTNVEFIDPNTISSEHFINEIIEKLVV